MATEETQSKEPPAGAETPRQETVVSTAGTAQAPPTPSPVPPTPYQQPAETIRSSAKWLVTAFAGVGAILVAGIPLTKLGDLHGWRLAAAPIAIAIALATIAYIIFQVAKVFTAPYITLANLVAGYIPPKTGKWAIAWIVGWLASWFHTHQLERIMEAVQESRSELYGADAATVADLNTRLININKKLREAGPGERSEDDEKEQTRLTSAAERIVAFANYEAVRRTYRRMLKPMAAGGLIVAVAVGFFAYFVGSAPPTPLRVPCVSG